MSKALEMHRKLWLETALAGLGSDLRAGGLVASLRWAARAPMNALMAVLVLTGAGLLLSTPAAAQDVTRTQYQYTTQPPKLAPRKPPASTKTGQMLVQANEINYDYAHSRVAAVGNVQIYFNQSMLEADRVVYDQKTKRLHAEGRVRITDAEGRITHANSLELTDDYRDGFIDSLRLETPDQTHMAATRADRTDGKYTVFQNGVYTACAPCKDDPKKPPLWQVKAARVIHDQGEKMLYFEQAQLEFFGTTIAYLPYFSTPDPTVKRKTGWLMPEVSTSSKYGFGLETPYYWALAPDYDLTLSPRITTKQGLLMQAEWRQRLINGAYEIRASGINQRDTSYFVRSDGTTTPGFRDNRGAIETKGEFALNQNWTWGWNGTLLSDRTYFQDYGLSAYKSAVNVFDTAPTEAVSQLYLTGASNRSFFDIRTIHYLGFSESDNQKAIPIIHPVLDYAYVVDRPILGGELGYKVNFTSLTREQASFDAINAAAVTGGWCLPTNADPLTKNSTNCLMRGAPGTYTRGSAMAQWRKSITDSVGQIWTPFASLRADVAVASIDSQPGVNSFIPGGNTESARVMPTVGLEYRYPFISVQSWGTQTIEPIAQVIVRPNEQRTAALPNEDAQSFTYSDANLFSVDKFSGWDRAEGGGRANVGVQATTQFNRAGTLNVLFGQSYQLFGTNSFAVSDMVNTGINSGLDKARSDYVGRITYQPNRTLTFSSRARLDEASLNVQRLELESRANFERWSVGLLYGQYAAQPELGLPRREGLLSTASLKIASNWVVSGGLRYDLDARRFNQTAVGAGYVDDCFMLAVNYITDYSYSGNPQVDHRIMLQIGLRTIGTSSVTQQVGSQTSNVQ